MSATPPHDPGGPPSPLDGPSSGDEVPPVVTTAGPPRGLLLAAVGVVVALVLVAAVLVVTSGGDDGDDGESAGGLALGGALAAESGGTLPANSGTVAPTTTTPDDEGGGGGGGRPPEADDLPDVTIPAESSPPTTIPGSEPSAVPTDLDGGEAPLFGHLVVDLEPGGHLDFAVHLRTDQEVQLLSLADDGIETYIEVFAPDGSSEGSWVGGEPGVVNGLEWYLPGEPLPATGTYVIRVIHMGGDHRPFALGFFGNA